MGRRDRALLGQRASSTPASSSIYPVKVEVGAIGLDDNATFSEEDGFCVNEVEGCEEAE